MSTYTAGIHWQLRDGEDFAGNRYSRAHAWTFDGGTVVPASSSPAVVPLPMSDAAAVDPEEAFVASLSSCHMLWFLAIAAKRGFVVTAYADEAQGTMGRNAQGKVAILRVALSPLATFGGERPPDPAQLDALHHEAHDACYIANSVTTDVVCTPRR